MTPFIRKTPLLQRHSSRFKILQAATDAALVIAILFGLLLHKGVPIAPHFQVLALITLLLMRIVYGSMGIYRTHSVPLQTTIALAKAWGLVVVLLLLFGFATKTSAYFPRQIIFAWIALGYFAQLAVHLALPHFLKHPAGVFSNGKTSAVIVGSGRLGRYLARRINQNPFFQTRVIGVVDDDSALLAQWDVENVSVLGNVDSLTALARDQDIDAVFLAVPIQSSSMVERVYRELHHLNIDIFWAPDIFSLNLINHSLREIAGVPLLTLSETPLRGTRALAKAIEDRLLAGIFLLLLSPLMALIALLIRLDSAGPIIFRQQRHGWNGETFEIYKFRSMHIHPPEGDGLLRQATRDDPRCTRVGRLLRRTSLDELPQLLNVLQGHMSLVGPRPHAVEHNNYYAQKIQSYMARHRIKPGMTGLAQVNGLRGETATLDKMRRRVELDLHYINNWSVGLDIRIMLQTVFILFSRHAY
ncbi:MAG: undecaprenyl-phosphate glucose phosphotransferase [Pseudomonadota bacterium]|nr:undecaprenyl-phosphate glucose phosphotransferase [Pseudomonadota bacterium]